MLMRSLKAFEFIYTFKMTLSKEQKEQILADERLREKVRTDAKAKQFRQG